MGHVTKITLDRLSCISGTVMVMRANMFDISGIRQHS